jgi:hypothetical protein
MTEVHGVLELTFPDLGPYGARSALDLAPCATFRGPGGQTLTAGAFSDGKGAWKVRFSPDQPGTWQWSLVPQGAAVDPAAGQVAVTIGSPSSPWRRHGPLTVHPSGRGFSHADGTPVFWLADTVWAAAAHATVEEWRSYVAHRAAQGFNVVQINALPQWDASGPPLRRPFLLTDGAEDFARPDPDYFSTLDSMVAIAAEAGLIAAIVVVWFDNTPADNEEWATAVPRRGPFTDQTVRAFARYLVARYEAYGAVWFASGDSGFKAPASVALYDAAAQEIMAAAARPPLITAHLNGGTEPSAALNGRDWLGFSIFQSCHFRDSADRARRYAARARSYVPRRPVLNSEPCYDSLHIFDAKPDATGARPRHARADVRRVSWISVLSGASAGITYGAHGLWPWHRDGQTYGTVMYGQPLDWRAALALDSGQDMTRLKHFFDTLPWWTIEPADGLITDPEGAVLACATAGEDLLLAYLVGAAEVAVPAALASRARVAWLDPATGQILDDKVPGDRVLTSPFGAADCLLILDFIRTAHPAS